MSQVHVHLTAQFELSRVGTTIPQPLFVVTLR